MKKKVLIAFSPKEFDALGEGNGYRILEENGFEVTQYEDDEHVFMPLEEWYSIGQDYDAIIAMGMPVNEKFLKNVTPRLKLVIRYGSGFDEIDVKTAREYGVAVATSKVPELSNGVAELAFAHLMSMLYYIPQNYEEYVIRKTWKQRVRSTQLSGKTIGFFGFGSIAQCFAKKLAGADVKMLAYDLFPNYAAAEKLRVEFVSFDELLALSDVISLHAPATKENERIFNEEVFSKMKDGSFLVNAARGILVDETALYHALTSGKLKGAACDTLWPEPISADSPLLSLENFIATPHLGGHTIEGRRQLTMAAASEVVDFFSGKRIENLVN